MSFNILSLDGGGIRSLFQAVIIKRLHLKTGFLDSIDYFVGTSGGSIVAGSLVFGLEIDQVIALFKNQASKIFDRDLLDKIEDIWSLTGAKYHIENLNQVLRSVLGPVRFGELKKRLLITSFSLKHKKGEKYEWRPVVFHNFQGIKNSNDLLLIDAITRSAAAPIYFGIYQDHVDGGVWANNPVMAGLSEAIREYSGNKKLEDIRVLSIGTLFNRIYLKTKKRDFGIIDWLKEGYLLDLFLDGAASGAAHYYAESLLGPRYHRFNPVIDEIIALDDISQIDKIYDYGTSVNIEEMLRWIEGFFLDRVKKNVKKVG